MNRTLIVIVLGVLILSGCKKKPRQNLYQEVEVPAFSNPALTVKAYIKAVNDNALEEFNECHHPTSRLKKDSGEYERLRDELKNLHISSFEVLQTTFSSDGNRSQVRLNWELKYTDPNTQEEHNVTNSGLVIELARDGKKWLINPTGSNKSFWSTPKVTTEPIDEEKSNGKE
ncbi:MAG: hypothetical protein K8S87_12630 [Planctomycetes bacterium]|nr:hypothetical protein [Planctomycetota bacterium]